MAEAKPDPENFSPGVAELDFQQAFILREIHRDLKKRGEQLPYGMSGKDNLVDYVLSHKVHSSDTPLCLLRRVALSDLRKDKTAVGKYVCVQVLEEGFGNVGWSTVVEDEHGNSCTLDVYNNPRKEIFCPGTVLIIKEPYISETSRHVPFIRCDCPSNIIIILNSGHTFYSRVEGVKWTHKPQSMNSNEEFVSYQSLKLPAEEWLRRGDNFLRDGRVPLALECYWLGLKQCSRHDLQWKHLNERLSDAYLFLGYYEMAIRVSKSIPYSKIAQLNLDRANYNLRNYGITHTELQRFLLECPCESESLQSYRQSNSNTKELIDSANPIEELLVKTSSQNLMKTLDNSNYTGPVSLYRDANGLFGINVTRAISANTILIVSKAVAASFNPDRSIIEVIAETVQAVCRNPETVGRMIYDLSFDGVSIKHIPSYIDEVTRAEPYCDVERIKAICLARMITINVHEEDTGAGLFIVPSYMKHGCEPNVYCSFINDVVMVCSRRDLACGDELYMNYTGNPITIPYHVRQAALDERGLTCQCFMCDSHI